jgi:signal transduction histidine kinase
MAESVWRMTRWPEARPYNAGMTVTRPRWHRPSPLLIDAALALALAVAALWEERGGAIDVRAVVLLTAPLICRRRWPLLVFGLVVLGAVMVVPAAPYVGIASIMVAAYSVGAYDRYSLLSLVLLASTATFIAVAFRAELPALPEHTVPFLVTIPLWLVGYALRTRQLRADALADRAARLEREQELATRAALAEEQARIARELHDVVAHNVSMMVVQAGAALEVQTSHPEQTRAALLAIESTGRGAMTELRSLLGILSDTGEDLTLAPQPGVAQLASLVQQVRDAGLPVELRIQGQQRPLPAGIELTVFRVVQEALTNALKHSGLARTDVILTYQETELKLEVLDQGTGARSPTGQEPGRGLIGMRERIALYGGTIEAGPRLPHGFAIRAWLPLTGYPLAGATP